MAKIKASGMARRKPARTRGPDSRPHLPVRAWSA